MKLIFLVFGNIKPEQSGHLVNNYTYIIMYVYIFDWFDTTVWGVWWYLEVIWYQC